MPIVSIGACCATEIAARASLGVPTSPARHRFGRARLDLRLSRRVECDTRSGLRVARSADCPLSRHRPLLSTCLPSRSPEREEPSACRSSRSSRREAKTSIFVPRSPSRAGLSPEREHRSSCGRPRSPRSPVKSPLPGPRQGIPGGSLQRRRNVLRKGNHVIDASGQLENSQRTSHGAPRRARERPGTTPGLFENPYPSPANQLFGTRVSWTVADGRCASLPTAHHVGRLDAFPDRRHLAFELGERHKREIPPDDLEAMTGERARLPNGRNDLRRRREHDWRPEAERRCVEGSRIGEQQDVQRLRA